MLCFVDDVDIERNDTIRHDMPIHGFVRARHAELRFRSSFTLFDRRSAHARLYLRHYAALIFDAFAATIR